MNKTYDLSLVFDTVSGKNHRWTLKNVRSDIASVYRPLVDNIIASGLYDAGSKGDLVSLNSANLIETTKNVITVS
jgi:hypothetical protein